MGYPLMFYVNDELRDKLSKEENRSALVNALLINHYKAKAEDKRDLAVEIKDLENKRSLLEQELKKEQDSIKIKADQEAKKLEQECLREEQRKKEHELWKALPQEDKDRYLKEKYGGFA